MIGACVLCSPCLPQVVCQASLQQVSAKIAEAGKVALAAGAAVLLSSVSIPELCCP